MWIKINTYKPQPSKPRISKTNKNPLTKTNPKTQKNWKRKQTLVEQSLSGFIRIHVGFLESRIERERERERMESLFCSVVFLCLFGVLKTLFLIKGFPLSLSLSFLVTATDVHNKKVITITDSEEKDGLVYYCYNEEEEKTSHHPTSISIN